MRYNSEGGDGDQGGGEGKVSQLHSGGGRGDEGEARSQVSAVCVGCSLEFPTHGSRRSSAPCHRT